MTKELAYSKSVDREHLKHFGQYFTDSAIADYMCAWACDGAENMLDPAVGNSVFFLHTKSRYPDCNLTGYELDPVILEYFGNPASADIVNGDYLLNGWKQKYDAIVCNPPYHRFQTIANRNEIIDTIFSYTGTRYSGYTNLYILFLIKSIFQLSENGRLAYIIPTEFLNSKYGTPIKEMLLKERLIRAIINFENNEEIFFNATTTCCILLLDHAPKTDVEFYNLSNINDLKTLTVGSPQKNANCVKYGNLKADEKWRSYLHRETLQEYRNLRNIADFCYVSRGIATGANDFFCFSQSKAKQHHIPQHCLTECICRCADVKSLIFTYTDFQELRNTDKTVYLLDIEESDRQDLAEYIAFGEANGFHKKHLPSRRNPWFSMERKPAAPIWVASACRRGMKFVRNLAGTKTLTTFHSVFVNEEYLADTDLIFCYFLTPAAQTIIRQNRKELGSGLDKFQPNDLNTAKMLDITVITEEDRRIIQNIYQKLQDGDWDSQIAELNTLFSKYLTV